MDLSQRWTFACLLWQPLTIFSFAADKPMLLALEGCHDTKVSVVDTKL